jgi:hypothetical protein
LSKPSCDLLDEAAQGSPVIRQEDGSQKAAEGGAMKSSCVPARMAVVLTLFLGACAIRPVPEDVAIPTLEIVKQCFCETRKAAFDSAVAWLVHDKDVDPESKRIGALFYNTGRSINEFHPKLFKGRVYTILNFFWDTGIAYNYAFEMTETNNVNTELNLLKPLTNSRSLGLKAAVDRERQNLRSFTVTNTFSNLIERTKDDYCEGRIVPANYAYPIAGRIGMDEMIQTFVNLTLHAGLGPKAGELAGPPTMVDELGFTTTVSGSAAPKVVFSPLGVNLSPADASFFAEAKRKDFHKVTISLALPTAVEAQVGPIRNALYSNTFFGRLLTASGGPTQQAAAQAVNQVLTLRALDSRRTVVITE